MEFFGEDRRLGIEPAGVARLEKVIAAACEAATHQGAKQTCLQPARLADEMPQIREHPGQYVTIPRAAEKAGVSSRTIRRMIDDGSLKAVKPRGHWRVSLASLRKAMSPAQSVEKLEYDPLVRR
jgi:excisionase family DNA binding protein